MPSPDQALDEYQRQRLYRHLNKQREDREKQGIPTSPRTFRGNHSSSTRSHGANPHLLRMNKRDVFSNEDCEESVGYRYQRDNHNSTNHTGSGALLDNSTRHSAADDDDGDGEEESLFLTSNHYRANIEEDEPDCSADQMGVNSHSYSSFFDESKARTPSDASRSTNHTRPISLAENSALHSSISTTDNHRLYSSAQPRQKSSRSISLHSHSHHSSNHSKRSAAAHNSLHNSQTSSFMAVPPSEDELNDFPGVDLHGMATVNARHSHHQGQQDALQKQQERRLFVLSTVAMCLLLLVTAGGATFWILGWKAEQQNTPEEIQKDVRDENNIPHPLVATPNPTTAIPSASPTPLLALEQWAARYLPTETWQAIQWNNASPNSSSTVSAPIQAYQWIQTDPYFSTNATSDDPNMTLGEKRQQRYALATLYYATGGEQWAPPNWLSSQDECQWPHFTCSRTSTGRNRNLQSTLLRPDQGATLQLRNVAVTGTLPMEISLLTKLSVLAIYDDTNSTTNGGLRGLLPSELGQLTKLTLLDLHNHQFTGTIPTSLGRLRNLQRLYLHDNAFLPNSIVPDQLCLLALKELSVDCLSINCTCGCMCPTGGNSTNTFSHNIFDHTIAIETGPLTRFPVEPGSTAVPSSPAPVVHMVTVTNPPTPMPPGTFAPGTIPPAIPATSAPTPAVDNSGTFPPGLPDESHPPLNQENVTIGVTSPPSIVNSANGSATILPGINTNTTLLCNGLANICDISLPKVLTPVVHNAMASQADGFSLANHLLPVEDAIVAGYRGIALDLCNCEGELVFCHSVCLVGTRSIAPLFQNLHQFLLDNPHEVFILTFEINLEQGVDLAQFYAILQSIGNFTDYIYEHDPMTSESWPTLRSLIEQDKRLVLFHYNGPTCEQPQSCPPGLHYYFDYAAETQFDFKSIAELLDTASSCQITRGGSGKHRAFFGINNFLQTPEVDLARTINAMGFLKPRVATCAANNGGLDVSFLSVDYWSIGNVLDFAREHNQQLEPLPPDHGHEERYGIHSVNFEYTLDEVALLYELSDYVMDTSVSYKVYDGILCRNGANDITDANPYFIMELTPPADAGPNLSNNGEGNRGPFEFRFSLNKEQILNAPFYVPVGPGAGQLNFCIGLIIGYNKVEGWNLEKEVNAVETALQITIDTTEFRSISDLEIQTVVNPSYY